MVAAWNGHEKVVQVLLGKNNVNPNIPDKRGEAPLWCAAWLGHAAVVRLLLKRDGINADPKMNETIRCCSGRRLTDRAR